MNNRSDRRRAPVRGLRLGIFLLVCALCGRPAPVAAAERVEVRLPALASLAAEDAARDAAGLPWRYAVTEAVRLSPARDGRWERSPDGSRRWQLEIASPGALTLNLGFGLFWLPAGATLTVFSPERTGPALRFDAADNRDHGQLWTPMLAGDALVVELTVPAAADPEPLLELVAINSGYRLPGAGTDKSGACNVDVVCSEGDDWRAEIASVGLVSVNGSYICSGALINNAAFDGTPLFLTANHCGISGTQAPTVVIYWNFESPTCGQHGGGSLAQFTTGSTLRASWNLSDFTLLELDEQPDPTYGVTYSGWNRGEGVPSAATTIHHPDSDEKSISFENDPLESASYLQSTTPGDGTHLRVIDWDLGTTEPGSSGSPLFDQDHLVIGQLHGGWAACGNNESDWYGRLYRSWEGGGTSGTCLRDWLDPAGTGAQTVPLLDPADSEFTISPLDDIATGGPMGGPFAVSSWQYTLANDGTFPVHYAATVDRDWLEVTPTAGTIGAGSSATVTVSLTGAAAALQAGLHTATLSLANPVSGSVESRAVALDISATRPYVIGAGPNPFGDQISIHVALPVSGPLTWRVHDLRGRLVRPDALMEGDVGENSIVWDGRDGSGRRLPAGVYVVVIGAGAHEFRVEVVCAH